MLRLTRLIDDGSTAGELAGAAPRHVLRMTYDQRVKTRHAATCEDGTDVGIVLARGTVLRDGALLESDGGARVLVRAAPQPLARITARTPLALLRAVYHLANRHVPVQLSEHEALIERDPVLERMLAANGARIEHIDAPFDPEPGAYEGHGHHLDAHAHDGDDGHAHGGMREHAHGHDHGHKDHHHRDEVDEVSATVGEQLSVEAFRRRMAGRDAKS